MDDRRYYTLSGKFESQRRTFCTSNGKITGLIDLVTIEDGEAIRKLHEQLWHSYQDSEPLLDVVTGISHLAPKELFPKENSKVTELLVKPGDYFPRIFRPFYHDKIGLTNVKEFNISHRLQGKLKWGECLPSHKDSFLQAFNQLSILKGMLTEIFQNIHPCSSNLNSFGQSIKNLLILSCVEVEAQLQSVLVENNVKRSGNYYNTSDYVKTLEPLQLDKYCVSFKFYKGISERMPFKHWDSKKPSVSLTWYDAYNKIKHGGESEFYKANLDNVLSAISAFVVLIHAQFGDNLPYWEEEFGSYFTIRNSCCYSESELLIPPVDGISWSPQDYAF